MHPVAHLPPTAVIWPAVARRVLLAFLLTFISARVLVYLIMAHDVPDLFLHLGQTHVHHLNYGIFLLSAVGAWLLFAPQTPARRRTAALFYGMGMALTYDEFGMWLHLGGSYWQRASWDAVGVVTAILALAGFAWPLKHYANRHWAAATAVLLSTGLFFALLVRSLPHAERLLIPRIQAVEENAPL